MEHEKLFSDEAASIPDRKILILGSGRHKLTDILEYVSMCNLGETNIPGRQYKQRSFTFLLKHVDQRLEFLNKLSDENIGVIYICKANNVNTDDELSLLERIKQVKHTTDWTFDEINDSHKEAVGCYGGEFNIHLPIDEIRKIEETFEKQIASMQDCTFVLENYKIDYETLVRDLSNTINSMPAYNYNKRNLPSPHRKPPFVRRGHRQSYKPSG